MSVITKIRRWLSLLFRPGEPGPDQRDIGIHRADSWRGTDFNQGNFREYPQPSALDIARRQARLHRYRAGPWQRK